MIDVVEVTKAGVGVDTGESYDEIQSTMRYRAAVFNSRTRQCTGTKTYGESLVPG